MKPKNLIAALLHCFLENNWKRLTRKKTHLLHSEGWCIIASHLCVATAARKRADMTRIRKQRDRSSLICRTFQKWENMFYFVRFLLWHRMCSTSILGRGELWAEPRMNLDEEGSVQLWEVFQGKPERRGPSRESPLCQGDLVGCREMMVQLAPSSVRYKSAHSLILDTFFCATHNFLVFQGDLYVTHPRHVDNEQLLDALKELHRFKCWKTSSFCRDLKLFRCYLR